MALFPGKYHSNVKMDEFDPDNSSVDNSGIDDLDSDIDIGVDETFLLRARNLGGIHAAEQQSTEESVSSVMEHSRAKRLSLYAGASDDESDGKRFRSSFIYLVTYIFGFTPSLS